MFWSLFLVSRMFSLEFDAGYLEDHPVDQKLKYTALAQWLSDPNKWMVPIIAVFPLMCNNAHSRISSPILYLVAQIYPLNSWALSVSLSVLEVEESSKLYHDSLKPQRHPSDHQTSRSPQTMVLLDDFGIWRTPGVCPKRSLPPTRNVNPFRQTSITSLKSMV